MFLEIIHPDPYINVMKYCITNSLPPLLYCLHHLVELLLLAVARLQLLQNQVAVLAELYLLLGPLLKQQLQNKSQVLTIHY